MAKSKPECQKYFEDILNGKIVAGEKIKQLSSIMLHRIKNGYKRWHFDYEKANRPIRFIETYCCYPSGEKLGKPMELELFQKAWIQVMFGFVDEDGFRQFREVLWLIARKNGKALSIDTPIPTPDGYKQMRDIHPGDYVLGKDGKPTKVIIESEIFDKPMYRVTFEDGETIKASGDHIWTVQTKTSRRIAKYEPSSQRKRQVFSKLHDGSFFETTTEEMSRDFGRRRKDNKGTEFKYRVPMNNPIEYAEKDLPIDPYLLGVWLGDGRSSSNELAVGKQDIEEMLSLLDDYNPKATFRKTAYVVKLGNTYRDEHGRFHNDLRDKLRKLGVLNNKHIPNEYLTASIEQRMALLQGLMDTDGSITKRGQCTFSQKETRFLDDMLELLSGLGIKATYRNKKVKINSNVCKAYEIQFWAAKDKPCFRLKRKLSRQKNSLAPRMSCKSIVNIERIPNESSKCIAVDTPDHLFLCGKRYTVTHNSSLGAALELYMLMADGEGAPQIYNAANSKDQASLAYGAVWKMVRKSSKLSKKLRKGTVVERDADGIIFDDNFGYITPLSSQTRNLDGLDSHFALFDELSACVNRDVYDLIRQADSTRRQPMMLCITTNGFERNNIFDDRYDYGVKILDGEVDDDTFLPILYELDDREEWTNRSSWLKANPGLGAIKKVESLDRNVNEAMQNPSLLPTVLTKDFNMPENKAAAWLSFQEAVNEETFDFKEMGFRYGIGGFDASDTTDLSAACMLMMRPGDDKIYKHSMYWLPEESLRDDGYRRERDDVPFRQWAAKGLLRIVPGNKVPKTVFIEWLEEMKRDFDVWTFALGYDPWHVIGTDADMLRDYVGKDNCEVIRQGPLTCSDPMKQFRADLNAKRIVNNHNPIDEWCRMNTSVKTDVNANIQPVHLDRQHKNRTDGFIAELCAYIALIRHKDEYLNVI